VTETGDPVCNPREEAVLDPHWLGAAVETARREAARRRERYLGVRAPRSPEGKTAILVDDGIATGLTMRAAIREVRGRHPRRIVVAVPIVPRETAAVLAEEVDDVVAVEIPAGVFGAVGSYYDDFHQVTDEEVMGLLAGDTVRLFHLPGYGDLARELREAVPMEAGAWGIIRFPNGELGIDLHAPAAGDCAVLASLAPPDEQLLAALLLCDTLRRQGAAAVTLLAPYLAYTRQDREEAGRSRATAWLGALLQASGVARVVTIDVHSARVGELFPIPLASLSPARLFAEAVLRFAFQDAVVVAPDAGAMARADAVRAAAGIAAPLAWMEKTREPAGVTGVLHGAVGRRAVIVDDILDTGGTLIACARALRRVGAREMLVMVSHALFTGDAWPRLWDEGVTKLVCLDTVPVGEPRLDDRIHVLRAAPLLIAHGAGGG
ncbi:MAG TPA: ribose-phosphate diphosphokinase, partial [Armatimonadota bacterium]|nr:ribose-phosphate diphosphokinase [Armatimonadota bacterium]